MQSIQGNEYLLMLQKNTDWARFSLFGGGVKEKIKPFQQTLEIEHSLNF